MTDEQTVEYDGAMGGRGSVGGIAKVFREGMEQPRCGGDAGPTEQTEGLYVRILFLGKARRFSCLRILRKRR